MLTKAAERGLDDVVQLLLDAGADVEATNEVANVCVYLPHGVYNYKVMYNYN